MALRTIKEVPNLVRRCILYYTHCVPAYLGSQAFFLVIVSEYSQMLCLKMRMGGIGLGSLLKEGNRDRSVLFLAVV